MDDPEMKDYFRKLVDYSTDGGKCHRGLLSVYGFLELTGFDPDSQEAKPGYALGWAQEILQASFLVADDLMDQSSMRRGKPCWYLVIPKKYASVSDSYFLENVIYIIIDHYFENYPVAVKYNIQKLLFEASYRTTFGQFIDMAKKEPTVENWKLTVTNKTAYYSIWQPFVSGLVASQKVPESIWKSEDLKSILLYAGVLFQLQDDWIDLYGKTAKTGKIGTDIPDGKVSWLLAKALELANEEQKRDLLENVGHNDKTKIKKVVDIYDQLQIERVILEEQDKMYNSLCEMFQKTEHLPKGLVSFLLTFLNRRYY